jgi:hypothetical protein
MSKYNFQDGNGPVPAHKHPNGGGEAEGMKMWKRVGHNRWARGPLRVLNVIGARNWWFAAFMRGRVVEPIEDGAAYRTPEEAMKAADEWADDVVAALKNLEDYDAAE